MTEAEQLAKLRSILADRWWRLNHLYVIEDRYGAKVRFRPNWAQEQIFRQLHFLNVVLKVRQLGMSAFTGILQLDLCLFNAHQTCGIIDRTQDDAIKKLSRVRFAWEHLADPDFPDTYKLGLWLQSPAGANLRLVKNNATELEWSNGSKIWAGVSLRGSAVNFLHVSELGWIAHNDASKAAEIAAGSFNTVSPGNIIVVETTHEGGRYGLCYELIRRAQETQPPYTAMDWKFHFLPWWKEPLYTLPGPDVPETAAQARHLNALEKSEGIKLTREQRNWWVKKSTQPRVDMGRQYPGTAEEALQAMQEGAVYGKEISLLRLNGRVRDFAPDGHAPMFTFWDLGMSDFTAVWLVQLVATDILAIDYLTGQGETPAYYVSKIGEWERHYGRVVTRHYLPHDANSRGLSGKTYVDLLRECGVGNVTVVPRTPDIWASISNLRALLPRFYFHAVACQRETRFGNGDRLLPSGIGALEGFHTKIEAEGGTVREMPVHDASSHGEAALRTFADAYMRGMLLGYSDTARETRPAHMAAVGVGVTRAESERRDPHGIVTVNGAMAPQLQARAVR